MATVADVIAHLEQIAPPSLQESYDNSRLICGNPKAQVTGVIVSLDAIESIVDEAISSGSNLVVSHHPIVFSGLKSLTGVNYIQRTIIKAIKHDIALYAIHTNLDNVLRQGVNERLALRLELTKLEILAPKQQVVRHIIEVSDLLKPNVVRALHEQLAEVEERFDVDFDEHDGLTITGPGFISRTVARVCHQFRTNYCSQDIMSSRAGSIGAGMLGHTALPMTEDDFMSLVKTKLNLTVIRHTAFLGKSIQKVALCGGSGSFLLSAAIASGADAFVTADYKYHQFFDAEDQLVIADVGHFESEQFTIDLLVEAINGKFSNFAARCAKARTNPVHYFI
jgi:dinuclear metal center YbgI/SA1388 family protein